MNDTTNLRLPTWAAALPASRYFDLSQPAEAKAFYEWVYNSAYDMFEQLRAAVGADNVPGEGDGSGQLEDMGGRCAYFDFDTQGAELVSHITRAWELATEACDKAIFDFLQTVELEPEEAEA